MFFSSFRSVFQILIENHFPAPARSFLDGLQNSNQPTTSQNSQNSQNPQNSQGSPKRTRGSNLKRRVLAGLEFRPSAKKARVISYTDESDDEMEETMPENSVKPAKSIPKKPSIIDSDSESDVEMVETKKPAKSKKSINTKKSVKTKKSVNTKKWVNTKRKLRNRKESSSDAHMTSDESGADDYDSTG